jgi:nitroreductase
MDVLKAIGERRAIRAYTDDVLDRGTVEPLIHSAVQAPSARDLEPWAFAIFEGKERLREFSEEAKRALLRGRKESRSPEVRALLSDPSFDIFYGAPMLIVICAISAQSQAAEDCCLAAQNLILAAHAEGLATCPIGFARPWLNLPATKRKIGLPRDWVPVFPIILGHPKEHPAPPGRRAPVVMWL